MKNGLRYILGITLIFVIFIYVASNFSLSEIPSNSTKEALPSDNSPVYHEWDDTKPSLFNQNALFQNLNFDSNENSFGFQFIKQKQEKKGNSDDKKGGSKIGDIKETGDSKSTKNEKKAEGQDKKIERLKDRQANDEDNQRLIEQRNEFDNDVQLNTFDGYGLIVDTHNRDSNFNFAAAGDFGCSENAISTVANMQRLEPEIVLTLGICHIIALPTVGLIPSVQSKVSL